MKANTGAFRPTGTEILAVDDVEAKRYVWEKVLTGAGFTVRTASSGREALDLAKTLPDLIILDVRLPDIDGLEVCRRIKEQPITSSIPVLHVSASLITPEDRAQALEGGADGYLTEPVEPAVLIASVRALLRMKRAEDEARKSAYEWRATFDAIQDGVLVLDAAGVIVRGNAAFSALAGRSPEQLLKRNVIDVLKDMGLEADWKDVGRSLSRRRIELPWGKRWMRLTVDPIPNADGPAGATCIFSDITARKAADAAIQAGREELRNLNVDLERRVDERTQRLQSAVRELEAFTYTIAHDLRAPLRSVHRFSEVLLDEYGATLEEAGKDYARRIISGAERMDALIGDLLEYSRLGESEIKPRRLSPSEIAAEVCRAPEGSTPAPDVTVDAGIPDMIADPVLLSQVLRNLCSNALKFTRPGHAARVRVSGTRRGERVVLSVSDNGIGIPPESRGKLFKVFERLGAAKDYPGTGIGLAIVRRAVERMGGDCGVESEDGGGSRFWIAIPAAGAETVP